MIHGVGIFHSDRACHSDLIPTNLCGRQELTPSPFLLFCQLRFYLIPCISPIGRRLKRFSINSSNLPRHNRRRPGCNRRTVKGLAIYGLQRLAGNRPGRRWLCCHNRCRLRFCGLGCVLSGLVRHGTHPRLHRPMLRKRPNLGNRLALAKLRPGVLDSLHHLRMRPDLPVYAGRLRNDHPTSRTLLPRTTHGDIHVRPTIPRQRQRIGLQGYRVVPVENARPVLNLRRPL